MTIRLASTGTEYIGTLTRDHRGLYRCDFDLAHLLAAAPAASFKSARV